jgi:predicted Fe-Mo cluster-binding NifX family protein
MKVAIPTEGRRPSDSVESRFGRAPRILVVETETGQYRVYENTHNMQAAQGAGIQTAQLVDKSGAEWLLTGHCGPKAFQVLDQAGIKIAVGVTGTIEEVIERFKKNEYSAATGADVEGHWA